MNHEAGGPRDARPSALLVASLIATLHCNTILGIDEARCIGACDDLDATSLDEESGEEASSDAGSTRPRGAALSQTDAGEPGVDAPRPPEGAVSGALETPLANDAGAVVPDLDKIIFSACARQPAGKSFCVVNYRVLCKADGAAASVSVCPDVDHCLNGSGGRCLQPVCAPGERRCRDDRVQQCNAAQTAFETVARCGRRGCDDEVSRCND